MFTFSLFVLIFQNMSFDKRMIYCVRELGPTNLFMSMLYYINDNYQLKEWGRWSTLLFYLKSVENHDYYICKVTRFKKNQHYW